MRTIPFSEPVILAGGGRLDAAMLAEARRHASAIVAADSGADALHRLGERPDAIIGDMDSLAEPEAWAARGVPVHRIAEQDSTDFEKCLYATEAPLYIGVGFTGRRADHMLAVFHTLLARPEKRVVLIGEEEAIALAPPSRRLRLAVGHGARVSVFPLATVQASPSLGLEWPLDGLTLAPGVQGGTSNRATAPHVELGFEGPGALLLLERAALDTLVAAIAH